MSQKQIVVLIAQSCPCLSQVNWPFLMTEQNKKTQGKNQNKKGSLAIHLNIGYFSGNFKYLELRHQPPSPAKSSNTDPAQCLYY